MAKRFKDTVLADYKGEPIKMAFPNESEARELSLKQILWLILNNAPIQTQQDSIQGQRLAQALDSVKNGTIELEEGTHDWLKTVAEKATPAIFRVNGHLVYQHICEGFEKAKQPAESQAPSGGKGGAKAPRGGVPQKPSSQDAPTVLPKKGGR